VDKRDGLKHSCKRSYVCPVYLWYDWPNLNTR